MIFELNKARETALDNQIGRFLLTFDETENMNISRITLDEFS